MLLEPLEDRTLLNAGELDPVFGIAGKVTTDFLGPAYDFARAIAVQADGKIVVAGATNDQEDSDFALARYNVDGSLDGSFGMVGRVITDLGGNEGVNAIAIQSDGRIVVGGFSTGALALARYNPDGSLDSTFGTDGHVPNSPGFAASAIALQADGRIVVAGDTFDSFAVARYTANGSLDSSFGTNGTVTTDLGYTPHVSGVVIANDGTILVAGSTYSVDGTGRNFTLVSYTPEGTLNTTFGTDGKVTTDFFSHHDFAHAIALQGDGKIVLAGEAVNTNTASNECALARYNPDGSLDTNFGTGGKVSSPVLSGDEATGLAIQTDGRIVVTGRNVDENGNDTFALVRFDPDGSMDTSFGVGGKALADFSSRVDVAYAVTVASDGRLLAAGYTDQDTAYTAFGLAAFTSSGALDQTFGNNGTVSTDFLGSKEDVGRAVAIQADGKIVVAGFTAFSNLENAFFGLDFALARYNSDGSPDTSFGTDGKVVVDFGGDRDYATGIVIQSDGKIVVAGVAGDDVAGEYDFALARFYPDGSLDTSFGTGGLVRTDLGSYLDLATGIGMLSDGRIVVVGSTYRGVATGNDFVVAVYTTAGILDSSFGGGGKVTTDFGFTSDGATAVAIQNDDRIVVVGSTFSGSDLLSLTENDFALARYNSDGTLDDGGDLDSTPGDSFGSAGKVTADFALARAATGEISTRNDDFGNGVAIQADGKIVAVGGSNEDFAVLRLTSAGAPDDSFGTSGQVIIRFGFSNASATSVALQADSKIIVAGSIDEGSYLFPEVDFALVRLNSDGSLDDSFGDRTTRRAVFTDFGSIIDRAYAVAVQADQKIVVAGTTYQRGTGYELALARYEGSPPEVSLTVNDVSVAEGNSGTVNAVFTVTLSAAYSERVTVAYSTANGTAIGAADYVGADYLPVSGAVTFAPGETSQTITVLVKGDLNLEPDETFFLTLFEPPNASLADGQGLGTIINDDCPNAGSLDPSFGTDGKVITGFGGSDTAALALAVQPDGKIVVVGKTHNLLTNDDIAVARYNPDGSLDTSFGVGGKVTTDFGRTFDIARDVALQTDGKIVVAGSGLVRYNADGSLDVTFGRGGRVTTPFAVKSVAIQSDGRIVVAAQLGTSALARYNSDGSLDDGTLTDTTPGDSFGFRGIVSNNFGVWIEDVAIQSGNRIVLAGSVSTFDYLANRFTLDSALVRYNSDGSVDSTFGVGGKITADFGGDDAASDIAFQSDGRIVAAGYVSTGFGDSDFAVARYTIDGILDGSFGLGGKVTADFGNSGATPYGVAIQSDGKIVVAGAAGSGEGADFALARFTSDGSLDITFGTAGRVTTDFASYDDVAYGVAIQRDALQGDKIVAAGTGAGGNFVLARYETRGLRLSINDVSVTEGDSGTITASFTVTLSASCIQVVTVQYATADGTATAGTDYDAASGTLTFNPGETSKTITILVKGDRLNEPNESFFINLSNSTTATLADSQGQGTILDDDPINVVVTEERDPCDPTNAGETALIVHASADNEDILFSLGANGGVVLTVNGVVLGTFHPNARIIAFGDAGDDDIVVDSRITLPAWLHGGLGNDRLRGGGGNDVLLGEEGNDLLAGNAGRDLLIGGVGADRLVGDAGDDILIAGTTSYDGLDAALCKIMDEWTSGHTYEERVKNLTDGTGTPGANQNGLYFLLPGLTVRDDDDADVLTGSSGQDWFFYDRNKDRVTDLHDEVFASDLGFILGW